MKRGGKSGNQTGTWSGTNVTHKLFAAPDEKFAPGAFDGIIGKLIPMKFSGATIYQCKVISAVVADDGTYVTMELEIQ